jgi:hypothetical protein
MRSGFDSPTAQLLPAVASLTTIFCQRRDLHVQLVHAGMHPDLLATQSPLMASPSPFISTTRVGTPRTCRWFRVLVGVCVCGGLSIAVACFCWRFREFCIWVGLWFRGCLFDGNIAFVWRAVGLMVRIHPSHG